MLSATKRLLRDTPPPHLSVSAIAAAAEISVGSIYAHFADKQHLFLAVLGSEVQTPLKRRLDRLDGEDPIEALLTIGDLEIDLAVRQPALSRLKHELRRSAHTAPVSMPEDPDIRRGLEIVDVGDVVRPLARQLELGHVNGYVCAVAIQAAWTGIAAGDSSDGRVIDASLIGATWGHTRAVWKQHLLASGRTAQPRP